MKIAIFLNSGNPVTRKVDADRIVCADGGLNVCPVVPDYIVGDCDSVISLPEGIELIRHDTHKNFTDGEASVELCKKLGADEIDFYGVLGGRYDHTLCNLSCMAMADSLGMKAVAYEDGLDIYFANGSFELTARQGEIISVIPYGGEIFVTDYEGLEYPLDNLLITPLNAGYGISNVATDKKVRLNIARGDALIFRYFDTKE